MARYVMHIISSVVYHSKLIKPIFTFCVSEINKRKFRTAEDYKPI